MVNRGIQILDLLATHNNVKVTSLAEWLEVSQVTIRKDLDVLEQRGIIHRCHGYASLDSAVDVGKRIAINYSVKRKIAVAATALVEEGETIMIESGSCCALFAEELALSKKNVTIITNSAFITSYIYRIPNIKIILLGGYFQPESQVLVGPMTTKYGEILFSDKFFLGADGYISGYGFTGKDHLRVDTAINLADRAKKTFVLTDAVKFRRRGVYNLISLDRLTGVFTDEHISKEAEIDLLENNVFIYKVANKPQGKLQKCQ
jgi:DeoR/GlpR family transcriptional regulator of sugar metabolism